jgi:hypothetical protein
MNDDPAERLSVFDGFEGYRTATDEDYRIVLTQGLVVPDANVLLNLYRYNTQTRADLFAVLRKLGGQLWVPYQVLAEFWRNRESALRDPRTSGEKTVAGLDEQCEQAVEMLRRWANRIALAPDRLAELKKLLEDAFQAVTEDISARMDTTAAGLTEGDTNNDLVLQALNATLKGRIGHPMGADEYRAAITEGERRAAERIPPGYMDRDKKDDRAAGDYLVWAQILEEAAKRHCDVLLITGDVKEDWWRREHGQLRGPRLELVQELRDRAGTQLFMLRPESLLLRAPQILRVRVSDESVQDVERVDRSLSAGRSAAGSTSGGHLLEKLPEGRSGNYLHTLVEMTRLAESRPDLESFLDAFQERFPTITLRDVARRRMKILASLGLADISGSHVTLTPLGQQLITDQAIELLQDSLLTRIAGAPEIREIATQAGPGELRNRLRENPPAELSATQALLVLRWLEQLELV